MVKVHENLFPGVILQEAANDGSDFSNPPADYRQLFVGEDGLFHLKDSAGVVTTPGSAGDVATDAIFDAKGDLAVGTGANTAAKLTVGANDTIPMADSAQATGLKYVGSQTPSTQAFSDAAAEGTADTYARGDHKHGMPASPGGGGALLAVSAYAIAGDNSYAITASSDADVDATNLQVTFTAPASGNVIVRLSALCAPGGATHWTARESTTTKGDAYLAVSTGVVERRIADLYITGISVGSHTYKFGCYVVGGGTCTMYYGNTSGKFGYILMEVLAAP